MRAAQRRGHRQPDRAGGLGRYAGPAAGQGAAAEQFHDDQVEVAGGDGVVDPHHVRMVEGGEQPRLGPAARRGLIGARRQDLDSHRTVQLAVPALHHQPESSPAEDLAKFVGGQRRGDLRLVDNHDVGAVMCRPRRPPFIMPNPPISLYDA